MGFVIVAKAKRALFFWAELAWAVVSLGLAWICVRSLGLDGAGIAFCGSYVFHGFLIYPIVHRLSGFRWSVVNMQTGLLFLSLIVAVFCGFYVLPHFVAISVGTLVTLLSGVYSIRALLDLVSLDQIPRPLRRLLAEFGLAPSFPV